MEKLENSNDILNQEEKKEKIKKETSQSLNQLKNMIETQKNNYLIEKNEKWEVNITPNWNEINKITIKLNSNWIREFSHWVEWIITQKDLEQIELEDDSNDKNINNLNKIIKAYWLKKLTNEEIIEISLKLQN